MKVQAEAAVYVEHSQLGVARVVSQTLEAPAITNWGMRYNVVSYLYLPFHLMMLYCYRITLQFRHLDVELSSIFLGLNGKPAPTKGGRSDTQQRVSQSDSYTTFGLKRRSAIVAFQNYRTAARVARPLRRVTSHELFDRTPAGFRCIAWGRTKSMGGDYGCVEIHL